MTAAPPVPTEPTRPNGEEAGDTPPDAADADVEASGAAEVGVGVGDDPAADARAGDETATGAGAAAGAGAGDETATGGGPPAGATGSGAGETVDDIDDVDDVGGAVGSGESGRARRGSTVGKAAGVLAAVVFVVGTIGPPLFGRGVFLASDLLYFAYPWRATADEVPALDYNRAGPVSDTIDAAYPAKATFGEAARDGDFQTWVPEPAGGEALGPTLNGVTNPFALSFVVFPDWFAPAMEKLFQLTAALGFTYLFCRRLGTDRGPALFGAIAFAGSGFMVMWTNWEQTDVAAWIPALFWATERFLQKRTLTSLLPLAGAFAAMLVGFFPAIVFYALYVLGPYVAVRLLADSRRRWVERAREAVGWGAALALGAGLAAYALVPFTAQLLSRDLGERAQSSRSYLGMETLVTTVAPKALGLSTEGVTGGWYGRTNQVEAISFLGMSTVLLALLAVALPAARRVPRGARAVLAGATLVLATAAFHGGTVLELLQNLPAFDNSFIGRVRSVLGFTVAALAALGVQAAVERRLPQSARCWAWAGAVALAAGGVAAIVLRDVRRTHPVPPVVSDVKAAFVLPALVAVGTVVAVGVLLFRSWSGTRPRVALLGTSAVVGLLLVESLSFSVPLLPNEDRSTLYPETPGIEFLQAGLGEERFAAEGWTFFGNSSMLYGLRRVDGHVFYQPTWKELLLAADPTAFDQSETFSQLKSTPEVVGSPLLDRLSVRYWAATPDHQPLGDREDAGLASASCADPAELGDGGGEVTVEVPAGAPVRAVVVEVCRRAPVGAAAHVRATTPGGDEGVLRLPPAVERGELTVALPEPTDAPVVAGAERVTLALAGADADTELRLAATPEGRVAADVVRAPDDGLRLAYADDLVIYERSAALPRIRWAGRSEVVTGDEARVERLATGDVAADTVVLEEEPAEPGSGAAADLVVADDGAERVAVDVDAAGDGFVVLADAFQRDWEATVDGEPAELLWADHAGVAVAVTEGAHRVELRHRASGQGIGLLLSAVSVLLVGTVGAVELRRRRSARRSEPGSSAGISSGDRSSDEPPGPSESEALDKASRGVPSPP